MKYCGRYSNKINLSVFDEISIRYSGQYEELLTFFQEHTDKKVILIINDTNEFYNTGAHDIVNTIHKEYPEFNFSVCLKDIGSFQLINHELYSLAQSLTVPYYFGFVATNFDQLNHLCENGASEVYLAEDICFDLKRAKRICDRYGVKIRVFPNVAQASVRTSPAHKKFFIRPEDLSVYEDVIDTLEFWGELDRQEIFYRIYQSGKWFGDLKEIIADFNIDFDSRCIIPIFAEARKTCGRKCMRGESCKICDSILSISTKLGDMNMIIKQKKNN